MYKSLIPEGKSGSWEVRKFTLTAEDLRTDFLQSLRDIRDTGSDRRAVPGQYTRLDRSGSIIMSDTPAELKDLVFVERHAMGNVLLHGFGLGVAAELALLNKKCESVTVIEKSSDVIKLVAPTLLSRWGKRLKVVEGDAFEWRPKKKTFQVVWSDIWDSINTDNLKGMDRLERMWAGRTLLHGFWCKRECLYSSRRYA